MRNQKRIAKEKRQWDRRGGVFWGEWYDADSSDEDYDPDLGDFGLGGYPKIIEKERTWLKWFLDNCVFWVKWHWTGLTTQPCSFFAHFLLLVVMSFIGSLTGYWLLM